MTGITYRGTVRGGVVLLDEGTLTEGTQVLVTPVPPAPGCGAAIIDAVENAPKVPAVTL